VEVKNDCGIEAGSPGTEYVKTYVDGSLTGIIPWTTFSAYQVPASTAIDLTCQAAGKVIKTFMDSACTVADTDTGYTFNPTTFDLEVTKQHTDSFTYHTFYAGIEANNGNPQQCIEIKLTTCGHQTLTSIETSDPKVLVKADGTLDYYPYSSSGLTNAIRWAATPNDMVSSRYNFFNNASSLCIFEFDIDS
jgi:hypothetical protein